MTNGIKALNELNETGVEFQKNLSKALKPRYNFEEEIADAPFLGCQCEECQYWDAYALKHGLNARELKTEALNKAGK